MFYQNVYMHVGRIWRLAQLQSNSKGVFTRQQTQKGDERRNTNMQQRSGRIQSREEMIPQYSASLWLLARLEQYVESTFEQLKLNKTTRIKSHPLHESPETNQDMQPVNSHWKRNTGAERFTFVANSHRPLREDRKLENYSFNLLLTSHWMWVYHC